MNKKQFSLLACTALLCACQPAQKQTTITGTLTGMESDTLIVNYFAVSDLSRPQHDTPRHHRLAERKLHLPAGERQRADGGLLLRPTP